MNSPKLSLLRTALASLCLTLIVVSCGGGGAGGGSSAAGFGAVGIALTDKPAELADVEQILITITAVELFRVDDGRKVTLYDGRPRGPFDLLELENESRPLAFRRDVEAGTYCKIRLTLSDMVLVFNNGEPDFRPRLPGNNKLDLNPRDCFHVAPGSTVYLQLDMDARSIHITQAGSGMSYNFRPVVFIDVIGDRFPAKLVRLEDGIIRDIDTDNGILRVCEFTYGNSSRGDADDCMTVNVTRETAAFDNIENDGINTAGGGDAISLAELMDPRRIGTHPVTVVGRYRSHTDTADHYPRLEAVVVELGEALDLLGTVTSGASDLRFNMDVAPNQAIQVNGDLPVLLQSAPAGGNGTRVLSRNGVSLSAADIIPPRGVRVDGVLRLLNPDYLNAALVIVDLRDLGSGDEASGHIERVDVGSLLLNTDDFPCEAGSGSFIVTFGAGTDVYRAYKSEGGFVGTDSLEPGQDVDISGECVGIELAADTIIIRM